jgi:hypothetical protein
MSATYNWAYKPGVTNKYGITISASAEDVKPSNVAYVALFGNDTTGNGSRQLPFRTIAKGLSVLTIGQVLILGSGVYREGNLTIPTSLIGDGDVTIDPSFIGQITKPDGSGQFCNIKFTSSSPSAFVFTGNGSMLLDCIIIPYNAFSIRSTIKNCVLIGNTAVNIGLATGGLVYGSPGLNSGNNTWIGFGDIPLNFASIGDGGDFWNSIFYGCNISIQNNVSGVDYSLFYNCKFRIGSSGAYTTINDLPTLLTFVRASYPAILGFTHCVFADPKFNNLGIGDVTLAFDSPAKNLSYFGTYVGARSIAYPIKAKTIESAGDFDFASATNLTIGDNSITFTNSTIDAQIDTCVIGNLTSRELAKIPSYGFNADRNGQYIDSIADLAGSTIATGSTLAVPVSYLVEAGAITYNSTVYQPGDRFTTVTGLTTFTTVASGVVREILEAPQRHTIMARFGDGGNLVTAGTALIPGNWYSVLTGAITYDSVIYNAPVIFKAVNTDPFSGSGIVELAMSNETFQHYEPNIRPLSNNVADSRTGAIVRGNGDPSYVRGGVGVKEFPISAKYMQFRYYLKASNLKP